MQSYCPSHSYLGLLEEENIVNDMNHMNVGKNERSSQGLVNYIIFFRQLANNKYFSTFYSQYYLNYYILFFLYIFWNSGTRIQILQNITAIILNSLGVQNQKIKKVFNIGVGSSNKKISIQLSLLVSLINMIHIKILFRHNDFNIIIIISKTTKRNST